MELPQNNIQEIFKESQFLYRSHNKFAESINDIIYWTETTYLRRLSKWLHFFNKNYQLNFFLYSPTIDALFEACQKNELFRTQTEIEFNQSLMFYGRILNSTSLKTTLLSDTANQLLTIALIYGKYGSLQVNSFNAALKCLEKNITNESINNFFKCLLLKYENPKVLTKHIELLSVKEIDILMYWMQGNNIKKHPDLEHKLTNKEIQALLMIQAEEVFFENEFLKKSIAYAKISSSINTNLELSYYLKHCKTFEFRIDDFLHDINFWIKVIKLTEEAKVIDEYTSIGSIFDFIEHKKQAHGSNYNLKGVTAKSLLNAVENWHNNSEFAKNEYLYNAVWKGLGNEDFEVKEENETYLFTEIRSGKQLFEESTQMKHCVFSYIQECIDGNCTIWSLKKTENTILKNYLTMEIKQNKIIQVRGKRNALPTTKDLSIIEVWANINHFALMI